jgi:hypothetical protein
MYVPFFFSRSDFPRFSVTSCSCLAPSPTTTIPTPRIAAFVYMSC